MNLEDIPVPQVPDTETIDELARREKRSYDEERKRLENQNFAQDMGFRRSIAKKLFWVVIVWLCAIMLLVIGTGLSGNWNWTFTLPTPVLLMLIGSSTAAVIGLFVIVARYFFSVSKK